MLNTLWFRRNHRNVELWGKAPTTYVYELLYPVKTFPTPPHQKKFYQIQWGCVESETQYYV